MKKKSTILLLVAAASALTLQSYKSGPHSALGNRTASAGSMDGCGSCHGSATSTTGVGIILAKNGTTVTSYTPGEIYDVTFTGASTSGNPKFGFQLTCGLPDGGAPFFGTFALNGNASTALKANATLVEHTAALDGVVSNGVGSYSRTFKWTAPASGSGDVRFYIALNAVNGNNSDDSGDKWNLGSSMEITETTTSGINDSRGHNETEFSIFPNPSKDKLSIQLDAEARENFTINVVDLTGKTVSQCQINMGSSLLEINISSLSAGNYLLILKSKTGTTSKQFVKQ